HLFFAALYTAMSKILVSRPRRVVTFHNLAYDSYPADSAWKKIRKAMDARFMHHGINGYSAVSRAVADHYAKHLGVQRVEVIPNALPLDRFKPQPGLDRKRVRGHFGVSPKEFLLVMPGRLVPEKGHRFFLQALVLLRERRLCPRVIILGDGPLAG